jgi:hypothetical protein
MQHNANRRCETCRYWHGYDDMFPPEDRAKYWGECANETRQSYGDPRLPEHGTKCPAWAQTSLNVHGQEKADGTPK